MTTIGQEPGEGSILVVDDNPINVRLLSQLLTNMGYDVRQAMDGAMAIKSVHDHLPDLILLDIMMPHLNGYEVCARLKADPYTADLPVIVLSALNASFDKVKAFQCGATDYITKPFQFEEVLARVKHQLALKTAQQDLRQLTVALESRVQERTSQLEIAHAQLMEMVLQDQLTGLPNRLSFSEQISGALKRAQEAPGYQFAILFLDCDRFKMINDSLGHSKGDQLLIEVANRLRQIQQHYGPPIAWLARFGGDEFALLLTNLVDDALVTEIAQSILGSLSAPFHICDRNIYINASIGLVWGSPTYKDAEYLLRDADTAMYRAKASGKGQYRWFESAMHNRAVQLLHLDTALRVALDRQEFSVHYQPIVHLQHHHIIGLEALVRWWHPAGKYIPPDDFIPFSEETGLINEIGKQVLKQACAQLSEWQQLGLVAPDFTISVNLSAKQLRQPELVETVCATIADTGIQPQNLRLELTESAIIENRTDVDQTLHALRQHAIKLSIDDFGTGYSSLSYLHTLPVNYLKVDRSFVQSINDTSASLGIIPLIINIARTMNMQIIAEGIETHNQFQQLRGLECEYGQGYFFYKPLPADQITILLQQHVQATSA
ncbi:MAG: EAL domain-containing protein [Cyanobacteria bacterium P01_D01_bin.44]